MGVGATASRPCIFVSPLVNVSPCHLVPSQAQLAHDATLDTPEPASNEPDHGSTAIVHASPLANVQTCPRVPSIW